MYDSDCRCVTHTLGWALRPRTRTGIYTVFAEGWPGRRLQRFDGARATVNQVSTALNKCCWVHFSSHTSKQRLHGERIRVAWCKTKAMYPWSQLSGSLPLNLRSLQLIRHCHWSASGSHGSSGEAMQVSAGMKFAGFPVALLHCGVFRTRITSTDISCGTGDDVDPTEASAACNYAVSCLREYLEVT